MIEYDDSESIINPTDVVSKIPNFPKLGVACFSKKIIDYIASKYNLEQIGVISNTNAKEPIYKINYQGQDIAIFMMRVGSSACVMAYEEILAMGLEKLVVFGNCGVLNKNIQDLEIIIPTSAIREEGTSYHYISESKEISLNEKYLTEFVNILNEQNLNYTIGKTWTTDAPYRETKNKVQKYKENGCVCVEMESSSLAAVAKYRKKDLFIYFYAADNLDNNSWEKRSLCEDIDIKDELFTLALNQIIKMN